MDNTISYFGIKPGWEDEVVGLRQEDRRNHLLVIGKTNSGKSTLLRNLIVQDILSGRGLAVLDPHGDMAAELLDTIPPWRLDHVTYLDPAGEREWPISFNPLLSVPPDERHLIAERVVAIFRAIWHMTPQNMPRAPRVLYNCLRALLDLPPRAGATLLGVGRLLADIDYRARVVRHIQNSQCLAYWRDEIGGKSERDLSEVFDPICTRVGTFLQSPELQNILGQPKRKVDPRFIMDNSRILIVNLRKGRLGPEAAHLLGALIVSEFESAAYSREELPEAERVPFYLYADEFQNFTTESFASALSEVRKYGLALTLAHQFQAQVAEEIRSAVIGNVGSIIAFRVGEEDAPDLAKQFAPFPAKALLELDRFQVLCKVMRGGVVVEPMIANTLPPLPVAYNRGRTAIERSRRHFARPRREVEERIARWMAW